MLIHIGFGHSPYGILFRTRQAGLADPSAVALLKRLRKSREWLCALRVELMREYGIGASASEGFQVRTFDAETGRPVASQNCAVRKTDEAIETAPVNIRGQRSACATAARCHSNTWPLGASRSRARRCWCWRRSAGQRWSGGGRGQYFRRSRLRGPDSNACPSATPRQNRGAVPVFVY